MRITYCKGTAAASLLLVSALGSLAQAQGLGEITLDSALNEPLRAHIELLETADLDATQIGVALASQSEFEVAGIANSFLLGSLRFEVVKRNDGNDRIEITSTQNINEPYLNFLLSVTWPNGRNLREYTLLLDLPVYNDNAGTRTPNPAAGNSVPDTATDAAPAASAATPAAQTAAAEGSYVVQTGDTLYQIAEQTRPSGDVSVQQMMLALQRANEDSFVNNNINRILTGKVLRIPTSAEIALIDQAAAAAQVAAQNQELMSQPLAVNDSAGNNTAPARDELTLLSGDQSAGGSGDLDATIAALENELMLSEENVDRARLENLELTNRLAALQEQIDLLQNIIAIEDERIAQLQSELSVQSAATEQALNAADAAAQAAGNAGLVGMLKYGVMALGGLLAIAVAGLLYIRRRRAEALDQEADAVALNDLDSAEPEEKAGIAAMLSSLLARFRRSDNDETDEEVPEDDNVTAPEPVAAVTATPPPVQAPEPAQTEADQLLTEMGLTDDFMDLDTVLNDVDNEVMAAVEPESAEPVDVSGAEAEASAALAEVDLLEQALDDAEQLGAEQPEAEQEPEEEDFLRAPAAASAAPESFAFTIEPVDSEPEPVATEEPAEDKPDVFEFTLPSLDEPSRTPVAEVAKEEKPLETFAFTTEASAIKAEPAVTDTVDDTADALEVLSFDEDSVVIDEEPDSEGYTPASSQDTHDARLDLAVAYEAMGDIDGAVEILDEVIASGRPLQVAEAERLKQKWQNG